jgi:hypothetical protein
MTEREMPWAEDAARRRVSWPRFVVLIASILASVYALEMFIRHRYGALLYAHHEGETSRFQYDSEVGWWGRKNMRETSTRWWERTDSALPLELSNNAEGFRDIEHDPASQARRAVFLGDSYTWGMDVTQEARFTELLRRLIPDLDIYNMGFPGFGTDQELLVLRRYGPRVRPSLVVVEVCHWNDSSDNASTHGRNSEWIKPYFELDGEQLVLRGVPVPELPRLMDSDLTVLSRYSFVARYVERTRTIRALHLGQPSNPRDITPDLLLAMRAEAEKLGARFLVTFTADMPEIMRVLDAAGCPYISFQSVTMRGHEWNPETTFPKGGWHWNDEGHRRVANILAARIPEILSK